MNETVHTVKDRPSVAIIGAGVCGLGIGWRLAQIGCKVDIFDRGEVGQAASWAAAGMLAARAEAEPGEEALLALNMKSQELWPSFAAELESVSDIDIDYRRDGTLTVARHRDDAEQLRFTYEFQSKLGLDVEWLSGAEARGREPYLAPGVSAGVFSPSDHQVDNRKLVTALRLACLSAGASITTHCDVMGIDIRDGRAHGVHLMNTDHAADIVVLAAGAWSRDIEGLPEEARPPVRPLKGQMLSLNMDPFEPLLRHVLWGPEGIYLVPRSDGRLLLGATVEEKGFDMALTAGGVLHLLREAWEILPGIDELQLGDVWVGHRPTSRDDAPILGPTGCEGLLVATGHHRNGILLAPLTAAAIRDYILTGSMMEAARQFGPDRFHKPRRRANLSAVG